MPKLRAALIWGAFTALCVVPVVVTAFSPLLQYRQPVYIAAGFAGTLGLVCLLVQPMLAGGALPGLARRLELRWHRIVGVVLVAAVVVSANRVQNGKANAQKWDSVFDRVERDFGVSRGVLLAFWAFETDFGAFQGDFNTANALVTLAHDCRRPELFRPQAIAAIELFERGELDPATTTGAWAGEIGMVQMLPGDIIESGMDGDDDGKVSLKTSPPDALMSGGNVLSNLGWRPNEPWLEEVVMPAGFDWSQTGLNTKRQVSEWVGMGVQPRGGQALRPDLPASVLLPQGRGGPAFLAYPNYEMLFEWNQSFVYVTTAAYFATRLEGAPAYLAGNPEPGLEGAQMVELQKKLQARGYDVGGADGILGARTRDAVQAEQVRLGMPADAWPTRALLNAL